MDSLNKEDLDKAEKMAPTLKPKAKIKVPNSEEFELMVEEMQNPVKAQKEMAVKIKIFLDHQIKNEMEDKGFLSEGTRKWIDTYHKALEKIQSSIHGDKTVNLHLHKVSHGDVSNKIREAKENIIEIIPKGEEEKKKSEDYH